MARGYNPNFNPNQVHALLGQWYDLVGPQVGGGGYGWGHRGPYGGRWAGGYNPYLMMGADPQAPGLVAPPVVSPPPLPAPLPPVQMQMPMGPPPVQLPMGPPPEAYAYGGYPFPPRAAVVDAPLPTQANRDILPMSTGVPILPTQSAQITGRPQTLVFKIGRFVISNAGTSGGAADWIVNDIKIGNRSQFVQSGDVPGDIFANNAIDTFVRFDTAQTAMDVVVVVTYIGLNESGCPFFGAMVGTAAV